MDAALTRIDDAPPAVMPQAAAAPEDRLLDIIDRAARDPSVDIDKLERLIALHERRKEIEAEEAFNRAMRHAQAEMPRILRDARNDSTNSRYSRLETIAEKAMPVVTAHGFSLSFGTDVSPQKDHYRVTCKVSHVDGHSRDYFADVPADLMGMKGNANKTATHGFGSTMSYGRRYLTLLIFNLVLVNEDNDGNGAQRGNGCINAGQRKQIEALLAETRSNVTLFLRHIRCDSVETIPAAQFANALNALRRKQAALMATERQEDGR